MAPSGGRTGRGDWKTDSQHYRRCQGVQLPVPAAVRGTTEGECGLISKHEKTQGIISQKKNIYAKMNKRATYCQKVHYTYISQKTVI